MVNNTENLLLFLPVLILLYFLSSHRFKWILLLASSCLFYLSLAPQYIWLITALILINYMAAILIEKCSGKKRKTILFLCVLLNLLNLIFFKFIIINLQNLAGIIKWNYDPDLLYLVLPIGLSYQTFQCLSYVFEVYSGRYKSERHFGIFSLYVMFFPLLLSGPIERPYNMLPQFHSLHGFNYLDFTRGLRLISWGLFKKFVIANGLDPFVSTVFDNPTQHKGISLIIAAIFFTFQIYCDFSGYTDIVVGSSQSLGIKVIKNFDRPFISRSLTEFWRRWHISLSNWARDYFFTPLLFKNRSKGQLGLFIVIILTFLLIGIWHGPRWTYVLYGLYHGVLVSVEVLFSRTIKTLKQNTILGIRRILGHLLTPLLVVIGFILFRSNSLSDAHYILKNLFSDVSKQLLQVPWIEVIKGGQLDLLGRNILLGQSPVDFLIVVVAIIFMEIIQKISFNQPIECIIENKKWWIRWTVYYLWIFTILYFSTWFKNTTFIYLQF